MISSVFKSPTYRLLSIAVQDVDYNSLFRTIGNYDIKRYLPTAPIFHAKSITIYNERHQETPILNPLSQQKSHRTNCNSHH
jgi:hypothetical protein